MYPGSDSSFSKNKSNESDFNSSRPMDTRTIKSLLEKVDQRDENVQVDLENVSNRMFDSNDDIPIIVTIESGNGENPKKNSDLLGENSRTESGGSMTEKIEDKNIVTNSFTDFSSKQVAKTERDAKYTRKEEKTFENLQEEQNFKDNYVRKGSRESPSVEMAGDSNLDLEKRMPVAENRTVKIKSQKYSRDTSSKTEKSSIPITKENMQKFEQYGNSSLKKGRGRPPKNSLIKTDTITIKRLLDATISNEAPGISMKTLQEFPTEATFTNSKGNKNVTPGNVSQFVLLNRSVRSRKKLMLPDFEYGFDGKFEKDECADQTYISTARTKTPTNRSALKDDTYKDVRIIVRKRGRPRKSVVELDENVVVPISSISTPSLAKDINEETSAKLLKLSKVKKSGDETEIFSLTTTLSDSEHDVSSTTCLNKSKTNDVKSEIDESWLKKLDFSEGQSLTDSWMDSSRDLDNAPKRGRPPKRKKVMATMIKEVGIVTKESDERDMKETRNSREECSKSGPEEKKKKRGRPKKYDTTFMDNNSASVTLEKSASLKGLTKKLPLNNEKRTEEFAVTEGVTNTFAKYIDTGVAISPDKICETKPPVTISNAVVTIKKRGRPLKRKPSIASANSNESLTPVVRSEGSLEAALTKNANVRSHSDKFEEKKQPFFRTGKYCLKKRGRPRKSLPVKEMEASHDAAIVDVQIEQDGNELKKRDQVTVEETDMKKRREFMEYMRIKEDVDDSDFEHLKKRAEGKNSSILLPKKRGRPRLDEVARKRAAAAELMKNERPYSIYNKYKAASRGFLKRKRNPSQTLDVLKKRKNRKRKLLDAVEYSGFASASETANDSSMIMSDSSVVDDGATLDDDDLPFVLKKSSLGRPRKLNKVKVKKIRDPSPALADVKEDETKNIDPDLYSLDMKNRAKYSRVFRKVRDVPTHDEYFPDSLVTCGRCKKLMTLRHYHLYHQISHYFLSWLDGEKELDFSLDSELIKIMQQYVNPDALRKKLIKLHCDQCHKIMKSVVGYVSHIRFCSKMNEEELLGSCVLCGKKLKPSSLRHHYVKTHNITLPNVNARTKDELFLPIPESSAKNDAVAIPISTSSSSSLSSVKKMAKCYQNFERKSIDKIDIIEDVEFWTSLKTSYDLYMCMGLSCKHMTLSKDDLKNHILNCHAAFCEFRCLICPFTTRYESEIIYHTKNACKDFSDTEERVDDESDATVTIGGRRVSNRVKKRKCRYEDEFFEDGERKRAKTEDEDFRPSDVETEEDDRDFVSESDEDVIIVKSRSSKRKSGLYTAYGSDSSLRVAFLSHTTTRQYDPLTWTIEARQRICRQEPILEELKINSTMWGLTSLMNLPLHAPKQIRSMKIVGDSNKFIDYDLFQSDVVKGVPISFVGGPVWALAWAPMPAQLSEQYLAVAGLPHMNHLIELNSSVKFRSLIQIWKYNSLDNISNTIDKPTLDLAIAHEYGAVSCMEWCPSGGFDNRTSACRLGILAVATSAGCVVVYSIPKLDSNDEPSNRIACPEPNLILSVTCDNVQCTRVVWLRKKEKSVICGGFSNGTIALWDICCKSSLLREGNKIYPYRTFEAHNASILALDAHWLDDGRYLLTSSIDRVMKYWDLEDLSGPLNEQEGSSPIVNVVWLQQWAVSAVGFDSSNLLDASAVLSHSRDTVEKKKSIANIRDTCWSIAYSDWNDSVALSLSSGQVSVFAAKHMSVLSFKQADFEKVITETSLIPLNDDDDVNWCKKESVKNLTSLPHTKASYDCTTLLQEFGLQFCDRVKNRMPLTKSSFTPDCCNILSVNKVCWNQNYNSFNWLAVGYESGFVRIFRVERFDKLHLTKFYKMNETCRTSSI